MRVEPGEGQAGRQRGAQPGGLARRWRQAAVVAQRRAEAARRVGQEEQRAAVAQHRFQPGQGVRRQAEAGDTRGDQHGIRYRAHQADGKDVFLAQALPQDEGILRADRQDQAEAEEKTGEKGAGHVLP